MENSETTPLRFLILPFLLLFLASGCGPHSPSQTSRSAPSYNEVLQSKRPHRGDGEPPFRNFDYYILSLSWAPTFCEDPAHQAARECDPKRLAGFVVHGLWPQRENGRAPEDCADAQPLSESALSKAATVLPDLSLARHEWRAHGSCTGLTPDLYFDTVQRARAKIFIPASYVALRHGLRTNASIVERQFAAANGISQLDAIRVHCVKNQVAEVRFCLTKSLELRPCSGNVGECRAGQLFMHPVR